MSSPTIKETGQSQCQGYCPDCDTIHALGQGPTEPWARALIQDILTANSIDLEMDKGHRDPSLALSYLLGPARGQMFGVMLFESATGHTGIAKAFSGQYNGHWQVRGWVPPLFDITNFYQLTKPVEEQIKLLSDELARLNPTSTQAKQVKDQRQALSRQLMIAIHDLYQVTNFKGQCRPLRDIFQGKGGMPTGTADCCAPKLLNFAALNHLRPLGISEFFLGRENRSTTRQPGQFYVSCPEKCQPILGFMLCGLAQS